MNYQDQKWRLGNLYHIADKDGVDRVFKPNRIQDDVLTQWHKLLLVLKSRQQGMTSLFSLFYLDQVCWYENTWACIIAHNRETLGTIFQRIQYAWDRMEPEIKGWIGEPRTDTKYELFWRDRNSKIYVTLKTEGCTNHFLHFSEYAQIRDDYIAVSLPTVPPNGMCVKESTPFGINNRFYKEYMRARDGQYAERTLCYEWWKTDEYQKAVRDVAHDNLTEVEARLIKDERLTLEQIQWRRDKWYEQEQPNGSNYFPQNYIEDDVTCFLSTGSVVFNREMLSLNKDFVKNHSVSFLQGDPVWRKGTGNFVPARTGALRIFEPAESHMEYVAGIDISMGLETGDDQSIQVLRRDTLSQVAVYQNRIELSAFAEEAAALLMMYNEAWACPERNSTGEAFIPEFLRYYPRSKVYQQRDQTRNKKQATLRYGYWTGRNKERLISLGQTYIRDGNMLLDIPTLEQFLAYQQTELEAASRQFGRRQFAFQAGKGAKDDLVIAFCLALEMNSVLSAFNRKAFLRANDPWAIEKRKTMRPPQSVWSM